MYCGIITVGHEVLYSSPPGPKQASFNGSAVSYQFHIKWKIQPIGRCSDKEIKTLKSRDVFSNIAFLLCSNFLLRSSSIRI